MHGMRKPCIKLWLEHSLIFELAKRKRWLVTIKADESTISACEHTTHGPLSVVFTRLRHERNVVWQQSLVPPVNW